LGNRCNSANDLPSVTDRVVGLKLGLADAPALLIAKTLLITIGHAASPRREEHLYIIRSCVALGCKLCTCGRGEPILQTATLAHTTSVEMPKHEIVASGTGDAEKGLGRDPKYGYDTKPPAYDEPFVHGHATIAEAAGTGGNTHRGLKSRHIQFLYVCRTRSCVT
jgi:hypothetical protein